MQPARRGTSFIQKNFPTNPIELVTRLYEGNPIASSDTLFPEFERHLHEDKNLQDAVNWHFFNNQHSYLATSRNRKEPATRGAMEEARAARSAAVHQIKERVVRAVLLDYLLPSGKPLRVSTFAECGRAGGWLARVAERGKPHRIVGDVLTEDQLWELHDA